MNIKDTEQENMVLSHYTSSGACQLRKDLRRLKAIRKIQGEKEVILTKTVRAILFPWSLKKVKMVLGSVWVPSLKEGTKMILGKKVGIEVINILFSNSSCFERLAKMDYKKAKPKCVQARINKINAKNKKRDSRDIFEVTEMEGPEKFNVGKDGGTLL